MNNCITEDEFKTTISKDHTNYNKLADRWAYYKEVGRFVEMYGPFDNVLEIGPAWVPVVKGCDTLDEADRFGPRTYKHNIKSTPWPMKDKQYDLVIALQVWEHIYNRQIEAFGELRRIAKTAIVSFPFGWQCRQPATCTNCHCGITKQTIAAWCHNIEPVDYTIVYDTVGMKHKRLIYYLEFDNRKASSE